MFVAKIHWIFHERCSCMNSHPQVQQHIAKKIYYSLVFIWNKIWLNYDVFSSKLIWITYFSGEHCDVSPARITHDPLLFPHRCKALLLRRFRFDLILYLYLYLCCFSFWPSDLSIHNILCWDVLKTLFCVLLLYWNELKQQKEVWIGEGCRKKTEKVWSFAKPGLKPPSDPPTPRFGLFSEN